MVDEYNFFTLPSETDLLVISKSTHLEELIEFVSILLCLLNFSSRLLFAFQDANLSFEVKDVILLFLLFLMLSYVLCVHFNLLTAGNSTTVFQTVVDTNTHTSKTGELQSTRLT